MKAHELGTGDTFVWNNRLYIVLGYFAIYLIQVRKIGVILPNDSVQLGIPMTVTFDMCADVKKVAITCSS